MKKNLLIIMFFILISCKNEDNNFLNKVLIEYHESKNNYTSMITLDFNSSELYLLKIYNNQNSLLKTPDEYAENNGSIYKTEEKLDEDLKRINLTKQEVDELLGIIESFEKEDYKSKKGIGFIDGGFVNYHLVYKEKVVNIKRINDSSDKQVRFNNLVFDIIKKSNIDLKKDN
ncbi:hypothetical protein SY27_17545 [Flavobacterium sp. 316]|uniref:Uncharacterized protein n=1 Tax=Flavobacterium sediminilitoris TaxID=2024526 RepID=A0ABY4HPZ8_9FLAO|nr:MULTISPECIES: hypothetical protein [Flavobacterium]KIX19849.1 hypothetical protein SY27_17545 [Flavobacterium sp. 316]UOX34291.1 hypothetical protein LXD69_01950 [Flavobacterium sediminilitoris]